MTWDTLSCFGRSRRLLGGDRSKSETQFNHFTGVVAQKFISVDVKDLVLLEGGDMKLLTPEQIRARICFSELSGDVRSPPSASPTYFVKFYLVDRYRGYELAYSTIKNKPHMGRG
ncbi:MULTISPECIES: hypothetical protein [unclassified Microcoleus]|uniref:hypothetical protein n=1 Tax=unclassified Microcoleus TaxID=2642155 RepID=UPI0025FD89DE|nr:MULTISPECIES: hypothetical protein [unclassified Microcoleus]